MGFFMGFLLRKENPKTSKRSVKKGQLLYHFVLYPLGNMRANPVYQSHQTINQQYEHCFIMASVKRTFSRDMKNNIELSMLTGNKEEVKLKLVLV